MNKKTIEQAAKETVQEHFGCNKGTPCTGRDYCMFCNGENLAFDCDVYCDADAFGEGFMAGANWRINSVWHDVDKELPDCGRHVVNEDWFDFEATSVLHLKRILEKYPFKHWAYVDDLLPERKGGEQ